MVTPRNIKASATGNPEFEIGRMKFILMVEKPDLAPSYYRLYQKAYQAIKDKGLGDLWYGLVFLSPEREVLSEVEVQAYLAYGYAREFIEHRAGYYVSGQDTMAFTMPPSGFLPFAMVHELGHRYWFKKMSSEQRARFDSLIKKRPSKSSIPLPNKISESKINDALRAVEEQAGLVQASLKKFLASRVKFYPKVLAAFEMPLHTAGRDFMNGVIDVTSALGTYTVAGAKGHEAVVRGLSEFRRLMASGTEDISTTMSRVLNNDDITREQLYEAFKNERGKWVGEALGLLADSVEIANGYIRESVEQYNDHEQKRYEWLVEQQTKAQGGPVEPVSTYGQSNIEEAFAEVFAHYILDDAMTRDQLESFKSVLVRKASAQRVASRWHNSLILLSTRQP